MWEIGDKMAQGAAMMTGTEVHRRACSGRRGRSTSTRPIAEAMYANIKKVGLPQWTRRRSDAREGAAEGAEGAGERARRPKLQQLRGRESIPDEDKRGGGSDDIGDVSWNVPTVTLRYPVEHPGLPGPQLGERDRDGDADRAQGRRPPARRCRR